MKRAALAFWKQHIRAGLRRGIVKWRSRFSHAEFTGKRVARINPESEWILQDVPDLQIIDNQLWQRVQVRLEAIRDSTSVQNAREKKFWLNRRTKHLLSGLARCGQYGAPLTAAGKDYLACSVARRHGRCSNRKGVRRGLLEHLILDALKENLMHPDLVKEFVAEFHSEINRQRRDQELSVALRGRELEEIDRKLRGIIDAIAEGFRAPALQSRLDELEDRKARLSAEIHSTEKTAVRLHPNLADIYRRKVNQLQHALVDPAATTEAMEILRGLIEQISVRPTSEGFEIELVGEIANMVRLSTGSDSLDKEPYRSSVKWLRGPATTFTERLF